LNLHLLNRNAGHLLLVLTLLPLQPLDLCLLRVLLLAVLPLQPLDLLLLCMQPLERYQALVMSRFQLLYCLVDCMLAWRFRPSC
jgi:hypothetical protein